MSVPGCRVCVAFVAVLACAVSACSSTTVNSAAADPSGGAGTSSTGGIGPAGATGSVGGAGGFTKVSSSGGVGFGGASTAAGGNVEAAGMGGTAGATSSNVSIAGVSGADMKGMAGSAGVSVRTGIAGSAGMSVRTGIAGSDIGPDPYTNPNCTDMAAETGTLTSRFGGAMLTTSDGTRQYYLSTNWWGKFGGQVVEFRGLSFIARNPDAVASMDDNPIGFPQLYMGSYAGKDTAGSNLPKQVSTLTSVPTVLSTLGTGNDGSVLFDLWFTPTSAKLNATEGAVAAGGAYLQIWLSEPALRSPRGTVRTIQSVTGPSQDTNHAVSGVDGTWTIWLDATNPPTITYVANSPMNGISTDLNAFVLDALNNHYGITSSMYLSIIFAGLEIWSGGDGSMVRNFCAKVN